MKRFFKWLGLAVVALVLVLAGIVFWAFHGLAPIVDGRRIDGVETIKDGIVACYLVDLHDGGVALVDACNDAAAKAILAALSRRGLGADAVKAIFLTHGDRDHILGALAFPKAQVLALGADVGLAEGRETRLLPGLIDPKDTGVRVTRSLSDGEVVELSDVVFRVYAVPGHTKGSAAFLARGVLFMGDSAETTSDEALAPAKRLTSGDPALNRRSLVALAGRLAPIAAEVQAIAPAHSGLTTQGLVPLLEFARRP